MALPQEERCQWKLYRFGSDYGIDGNRSFGKGALQCGGRRAPGRDYCAKHQAEIDDWEAQEQRAKQDRFSVQITEVR